MYVYLIQSVEGLSRIKKKKKKEVLAQQEEILPATAFIFQLHPSLSWIPSLPPTLSVSNFPIFIIV